MNFSFVLDCIIKIMSKIHYLFVLFLFFHLFRIQQILDITLAYGTLVKYSD